MLSVTVLIPRFRKGIDAMLDESQQIGAAATRVAAQNAYGEVAATFARDGLRLDPDERVGALVRAGDRLELLFGF